MPVLRAKLPLLWALAVLLVATGCRAEPQITTVRNLQAPTPTIGAAISPDPSAEPASVPAGGGIDFSLTRDDMDCDQDALDPVPGTTFVTAHVVVDGNLGAPCLGQPDPRLTQAWRILAAISPPGQLGDLGIFGGYEGTEPDEVTLAFVNTLDLSGSVYQMSIHLEEAEADPDELMLTMAHEFSHVFTSLSTQVDRFILPQECATWDNGEGCYREDSLMWAWIQMFWAGGLIDTLDLGIDPSSAGGQALCDIDPSFLGPYAATTPEEDFAETFSAFVFRLEVPTSQLRTKLEWFANQPGLLEFRNLATEAGLGPLPNRFERCG